MIILRQNILGHQQVTLKSLPTTLPNRNFIAQTAVALYNTVVEFKNLMRTDIQTENRQRIQLQRPLLSLWIFGLSGPIMGIHVLSII